MTAATGLPSTAGTCPTCGRETGNLARHAPACPVRTPATPRALARAAAHALPDEMLAGAQRFEGITDFAMATLMRALDEGADVHQGGRYGWRCGWDAPLPPAALGRTVAEAIRTGLARAVSTPTGPQTRRVHVVPAPAHLRSPYKPSAPACCVLRLPGSAMRWRLVDDRSYADCRDCLDAAY